MSSPLKTESTLLREVLANPPPSPPPGKAELNESTTLGVAYTQGFRPIRSQKKLNHAQSSNAQCMVFCADDRSDVDEHVWPYQTHGYIETKYADGTTEWGTGTLINDHHVLTAGHCIFSERVKYTNPLNPQRTWADTVKFYPAHDHERSNSNKWFAAHALLSNSKWVNDKDDAHDYGMIVLKSSAGKEFGWMGLLTTEKSDRLKKPDMTISGYPRDILKYRYTQRAAVAKLDKVTPEFLLYEIDTEKGQSGAPIWARFSYTRDELAIGIHTDVTSDKNRGVRLTRPIFDHYVEWIEKW